MVRTLSKNSAQVTFRIIQSLSWSQQIYHVSYSGSSKQIYAITSVKYSLQKKFYWVYVPVLSNMIDVGT